MKDLYGIAITEKSVAVRKDNDCWYPSGIGHEPILGNKLMSFSPTWGTWEIKNENDWIKVCLPISDSEMPENFRRIDEFHLADENNIGHIKTGKGIEKISVFYTPNKPQ